MAFKKKKKEKIMKIFGWLDVEVIKNLLGGLFPVRPGCSFGRQ